MGDGLVGVWENQPDPSLWRDQCDDEVKNEMKDKWAEGEREVRQMLDILKNRNVEYSKMAKERGFVGGAINFSEIIEEIEGRSGAAGSFRRLRDLMFELEEETAGEPLSNSRMIVSLWESTLFQRVTALGMKKSTGMIGCWYWKKM